MAHKLRQETASKTVSQNYFPQIPLFSSLALFIPYPHPFELTGSLLFFHNDFNRKPTACCCLFFSCLPIPFQPQFLLLFLRLFLLFSFPLLHTLFLVYYFLLIPLSFLSRDVFLFFAFFFYPLHLYTWLLILVEKNCM